MVVVTNKEGYMLMVYFEPTAAPPPPGNVIHRELVKDDVGEASRLSVAKLYFKDFKRKNSSLNFGETVRS